MDDQLADYRLRRKLEYEKKDKLVKIKEKYSKLLILNKKERSACRISNFSKKRLLNVPVNCTKEQIDAIPGIFRYRVRIYELDPTNNLQSQEEPHGADSDTIDQYILDDAICNDSYDDDPVLKQIMKESLMAFQKQQMVQQCSENKPNIQKPSSVCVWILLDLRIYGPNPKLPFYLKDKETFLTDQQQKNISELWHRVNPESVSGMRFQQYIDFTKTIAKSYNNINIANITPFNTNKSMQSKINIYKPAQTAKIHTLGDNKK